MRKDPLPFQLLINTSSSAEEIAVIRNNMEILKGNQNILSNQIQKTFTFVILPYTDTGKNRLILKSLQQEIVKNSTVHCLSKEHKAPIQDRNFFIIMFQFRSSIAIFWNWIHSVRIDILSILHQVSGISSQKLIPTLLKPTRPDIPAK